MSYITNNCSEDGFGSQFQYLIELILICYKKNSQFIYTPLNKINHNYDNIENKMFIEFDNEQTINF